MVLVLMCDMIIILQVVLIVSLIMAQWKVVNVLMPSLSVDSPPTESSMKLISSDESSNVTQSDELGRGKLVLVILLILS